MPIKRYLDEPGIGPEAARAMTEAFAIVTARVNELGLAISPAAIALRVSSLAHDGETDAKLLAETVLNAIIPQNK